MHLGKIRVANELLLRWLQFDGGEIKDIRESTTNGNCFEVIIEHPEIPESIEGSLIPLITPSYITYQDNMGNKVSIREPL